MSFDLVTFFEEKAAWSLATFGPAQGIDGVVAHIRKELIEVEKAMAAGDEAAVREEFADVALLAIDLWWRDPDAMTAARFRREMRYGAKPPDSDWAGIDAARTVTVALIRWHLAAIDRWGGGAPACEIWRLAIYAIASDEALGHAECLAKFAKLKQREWPDWRTVPADQPIEHVREAVIKKLESDLDIATRSRS